MIMLVMIVIAMVIVLTMIHDKSSDGKYCTGDKFNDVRGVEEIPRVIRLTYFCSHVQLFTFTEIYRDLKTQVRITKSDQYEKFSHNHLICSGDKSEFWYVVYFFWVIRISIKYSS